MLESQVTMG